MNDVFALEHEIDAQSRTRDRAIAAIAARQHGVVAHRQLTALGVGRGAIHNRTLTGRLHRVQRGVYAVGHPRLIGRGRWMAAVLAGGPSALLSHRSAAALWGLGFDAGSRIEVTVSGRGGRGRAGLALHHVRAFDPRDRTVRDGIPLTTIPRTLLDLAEVVSLR
jgi:predicted transcriptional regulator of viral defense system